jgi:hypothetical protein
MKRHLNLFYMKQNETNLREKREKGEKEKQIMSRMLQLYMMC